MQTVTVSRTVDASPEAVRDAMADTGQFMRAAGFDDVTVDGDVVTINNSVGLATIELVLELVEDSEEALVYEQREGIFEEMDTRYTVAEADEGTEVTATTNFEVAARLVGPLLDATVVKRQRRVELNAQFDYLDSL